MVNIKKSEWQKLDWAKKVEICTHGVDHEDSLLFAFLLIFIALEAMFFAAVFSEVLCFYLNMVVAVLGILVAIYFIYIFKRRGDYADRWGAILYALWQSADKTGEGETKELKLEGSEVSALDLMKHYEGCMERTKRGWAKIVFGWGNPWTRLKSPRLFITTLTPFIVIVVWIVIIVDLL